MGRDATLFPDAVYDLDVDFEEAKSAK